MKIKTLYAENIYSFAKFKVDFLEFSGVISIILGKNLDQKTANGAGKTSILKALYWALWNKELNGATVEEMINRTNPDAGMLSVLEFEDRGYDYKITRYKSYKPHKNSPKLHDGSPVSGSGVEFLVNGEPLMGDSHPKTQLIIEQKLRMTPRLFLSCVLMAQNAKNSFLTANDTEKKELLSELLDLQAYDKAFKAVKESIKEVEDRISVNENKIETLNEQIENNKNQLTKLSQDEQRYVDETNLKLGKLNLEIASYSDQLGKLKILASQTSKAEEIRLKINAVENKIKNLKKELSAEVQIAQALSALESDIKNYDQSIKDVENQLNLKQDKIKQQKEVKANVIVVDFSKEKENLISQKNDYLKEIKQYEAVLATEKTLLVKAKELELNQTSLVSKIEDIKKHSAEAKDNALCPTCLRNFKEGENQSLDKVIEVYNKQIEELNNQLLTIAVQKQETSDQLSKIADTKTHLSLSQERLVKVDSELNDLSEKEQESKINQKQQQMVQEQISGLEEDLVNLNTQLQGYQKNLKINQKKKQEVAKMLADLAPLKEQIEEMENSIADQRKALAEEEGLHIQIQQAKREFSEKSNHLEKLKVELHDLKNKANPYTEMKNSINSQIIAFKERLAKHKAVVEEAQEELKYLNFWKVGFAPVGIRSFITDDVIELLNRKTQENLNDLFDGAISVLFDPESKNNKGIISNKISTIFLHNGKETSFSLLSGGEQQRAILATELALTEVAEARAGTKLNLRFLDEPFTGMDNNGQVKSLSLFSRIARDKDGFFVISHDENFQHLCQKAMFVLKHKEISYIVDKQKFNSATIDQDLDTVSGFEEGENMEIAGKGKMFDLEKALKRKKQKEDDEFEE